MGKIGGNRVGHQLEFDSSSRDQRLSYPVLGFFIGRGVVITDPNGSTRRPGLYIWKRDSGEHRRLSRVRVQRPSAVDMVQ